MWFVIIGCVLLLASRWCLPSETPEQRKARALSLVPDFRPALEFCQPDQMQTLLLDPISNQFVVMKQIAELRVFDFDQLVAVEVLNDGQSLEKTNRGSQMVGAAVGGVLLGGAGLLLGGLTGAKRKETKVKQLSLKLYTNDLHAPILEIVFFKSSQGLAPESQPVKEAASLLDEWYARFRTIMAANAERKALPSEPVTAQSPQTFGRRRGLLAES